MDAAEWLALFTLCTAASFTPGPNTTLSTSMAATVGLRSTLPFIFGVGAGWSVLLMLSVTGMSAAVLEHPRLRQGLVSLGAIYLLWLARRIFHAHALQATNNKRFVGFWGGVALQFLNIKAWLLAMTISTGWVIGRADVWDRWLNVWPVVVAFAFVSNFTYAMIGASLSQWLQVGQRLRAFNSVMAISLAVLAVWLGVTQW